MLVFVTSIRPPSTVLFSFPHFFFNISTNISISSKDFEKYFFQITCQTSKHHFPQEAQSLSIHLWSNWKVPFRIRAPLFLWLSVQEHEVLPSDDHSLRKCQPAAEKTKADILGPK